MRGVKPLTKIAITKSLALRQCRGKAHRRCGKRRVGLTLLLERFVDTYSVGGIKRGLELRCTGEAGTEALRDPDCLVFKEEDGGKEERRCTFGDWQGFFEGERKEGSQFGLRLNYVGIEVLRLSVIPVWWLIACDLCVAGGEGGGLKKRGVDVAETLRRGEGNQLFRYNCVARG